MGGTGISFSKTQKKDDAVIEEIRSNLIIKFLNLDSTSCIMIGVGFVVILAFASWMNTTSKVKINYKLMTQYQMNKPFIWAGTILLLLMIAFIYLLYSIALRSIYYTSHVCNPAGSYDYDVLPCNSFINKTVSSDVNPEPFQNIYANLDVIKNAHILKILYKIYSIIFRGIESGLGKTNIL